MTILIEVRVGHSGYSQVIIESLMTGYLQSYGVIKENQHRMMNHSGADNSKESLPFQSLILKVNGRRRGGHKNCVRPRTVERASQQEH